MHRVGLYAALVLGSLTVALQADHDTFSTQEWALIKTLSPLPPLPVDTTNKYRNSRAAALLGQKLFFEPRLSGPIQTGTPAEGQLGTDWRERQNRVPGLPHARVTVAVRHQVQQRWANSECDGAGLVVDDA